MLALLAALLTLGPNGTAAPIKVTIVQGQVEAKATADSEFAPLKGGSQIDAGCTIRTGAGGKALFDFSDGYELRVNEQTELVVETPKKLMLKHGRVFFRLSKAAAPVDIATELHPVKLDECVADIEYKPRVPNGAPAATTYRVLEGKLQAFSKKFSPVVTTGWVATGYGSQLNTPDAITNGAVETAWVHSLLVERGRAEEEAGVRTEEMLGSLARENPDPVEPALRSLGELAAPGLARFLGRSVVVTQVARRAAAARILSDAATIKSAALLVPLLSHQESEVRVQGGRGLARIAGKDLGYADAYWKGDKVDAGRKAWEEWVRQNAK